MWFTIHSLGLGTKLRYLFIMASIWIKCNSITNVTKSATFQFHSLCKLVHIALSCLAYSIVIHWGEEEAKAGVSEVWSLYNSEKRTLFFYQTYLLSPQLEAGATPCQTQPDRSRQVRKYSVRDRSTREAKIRKYLLDDLCWGKQATSQ